MQLTFCHSTHTRKQTHTDTQLSGRWMPDNMSSHLLRSPAPAPALCHSMRACLYGCTRSAWILSIDVTAVKISTKQRMPHSKREREREREIVGERFINDLHFACWLKQKVLPHGVCILDTGHTLVIPGH